MVAHPGRQRVHGAAVEAVRHKVLDIPSPDGLVWHAMEPALQELLDAHATIELQKPPFHLRHPVRLKARLHPLVDDCVPAHASQLFAECICGSPLLIHQKHQATPKAAALHLYAACLPCRTIKKRSC